MAQLNRIFIANFIDCNLGAVCQAAVTTSKAKPIYWRLSRKMRSKEVKSVAVAAAAVRFYSIVFICLYIIFVL